jgi:hypothetical protein
MNDNTVVNIGDLCVYCARSTAFGSGLFVNRIGADSQWTTMNDELVWVDGWMCPDCQEEGEALAEQFGHYGVDEDLTEQ